MLPQTVKDTIRTKIVDGQWVHPMEDRHYTITGGRITRLAGRNRPIDIGYEEINLPVHGVDFHVFQIGPYLNDFFNTPTDTRVWVSFSYVIRNYKNHIMAFDIDGIVLDATKCWMWVHDNGTIYIAVEETERIDFAEDIFFRFFTPAWALKNHKDYDYTHKEILTDNDLIDIQNEIDSQDLHYYAYINGHFATYLSPINTKIGDTVEVVYDPTVRRVIDFPVSELPFFTSEKDKTQKYILHPEKDEDFMLVAYRDDLEVYVFWQQGQNISSVVGQGRYLPRTGRDTLRMLTHRDYSIRTDDVQRLSSLDAGIGQIETVRLYLKHSSTERHILRDGARLLDLYRLPDDEIIKSIVGARSYYEGWKAASLESWPFIEYVSSRDFNKRFDPLLILGYQGMVDYVYDTVRLARTANGFNIIDVPDGQRIEGSVCYQYDADGLLLGTEAVGDVDFINLDENVHYGEFISGRSDTHHTMLGKEAMITNEHHRIYKGKYPNGKLVDEWVDVTGELTYTEDFTGIWWDIDPIEEIVMVRDSRRIHHMEHTLTRETGFYSVALTEETYLNGELTTIPAYVGFGAIDVFLNGHSLTWGEGFEVHKERLYILDHEVVKEDEENLLVVRFYGRPEDGDTEWVAPKEVGYVDAGQLSKDAIYGLVDDQVTRISVAGALSRRKDIALHEEGNRVMELNGRPYELRDYRQPIHGLADDPYQPYLDYREKRTSIEDQLQIMHRYDDPELNDTIPKRYSVYSPLLSKLLFDARTQGLDLDTIRGDYDDRLILEWVDDHKELLKVDPYFTKRNLKWKIARPFATYNAMEVDWYEYRLLERANRVIFQDRYNLETATMMVKADV